MESNVYQRARQEWDERYADLVLGKRNCQIAAGGLLLLSLILASGFVWLARWRSMLNNRFLLCGEVAEWSKAPDC